MLTLADGSMQEIVQNIDVKVLQRLSVGKSRAKSLNRVWLARIFHPEFVL